MSIFDDNLYDDFDEIRKKIFGKFSNKYTRPVYDQRPLNAMQLKDGSYIIIYNTLGINANDVKIKVENVKGNPYPVLNISGSTEIPAINFKNEVNLSVTLKITEKIKSVSYKVENGLTIVKIDVEQPHEDLIPVKHLSSEDFDF